MSQGLHDPTPSKVASLLTVISVAMCSGVFTFGVVAYGLSQGQPPKETFVISLVSVAMAIMLGFVGGVLPSILLPTLLKNIRQQPMSMPAEEALLRAFFTTHVIKLALLEAPAFLALVAYIIEHHVWVIGVAVASVVLMVIQIPSERAIKDWLKYQRETFEMDGNQN